MTPLALLEDLLKRMLLTFDRIEEDERDGMIRLNIITDDPAILIGRHGDTLFSLQQILRLMLRRHANKDDAIIDPEYTQRIIVDVNDYRRSQEKSAELVAQEIARHVRETGAARELVPMPSYKRRAVHTLFSDPDYADLHAFSVGEGEDRRIRIEMKA